MKNKFLIIAFFLLCSVVKSQPAQPNSLLAAMNTTNSVGCSGPGTFPLCACLVGVTNELVLVRGLPGQVFTVFFGPGTPLLPGIATPFGTAHINTSSVSVFYSATTNFGPAPIHVQCFPLSAITGSFNFTIQTLITNPASIAGFTLTSSINVFR